MRVATGRPAGEVADNRVDKPTAAPLVLFDISRLIARIARTAPTGIDRVELAYARGLLLKEIALSMQISEETVKKRVQRARLALAQCVQDGSTQ